MSNPCWKCYLCKCFKSQKLKQLMKHYYQAHASDINFCVTCHINGCPASFKKYNSFYVHVRRCHALDYSGAGESSLSLVGFDSCAVTVNTLEGPPDSTTDKSVFNISINDDDDSTQDSDTPQDEIIPNLKRTAAHFILKVKERNKITQVALEGILAGTKYLIQQILNQLQNDLNLSICDEENGCLSAQKIKSTISKLKDPFFGMNTHFLQTSYIKNHLNVVQVKEIVFGTKLIKKKLQHKRILVEKNETFCYIPILDSIQQMLSNKRIAKEILKPPFFSREHLYYDICDGSMFRTDPFFLKNPCGLQLILYHDEVEVCNPLGSQAGKHKLDMFYYTMANINPKFRSNRCAIRLLAISNAKLVKKYGIASVLKPILKDIKLLENGCIFKINGKSTKVFGKVVSCTGDTEGQHQWGGYKLGVGFSFQKCRHCYCTFDDMQTQFNEDLFLMRSKEMYNNHCTEIENALKNSIKNSLKTAYGINERSSLCQFHNFDITLQLPQDIMHTVLEGTLQYEVRLVILHWLSVKKFTLAKLNGAIINHAYGYSETADKPSLLRESVFSGSEGYKLKYKAAQARLFLRILPFLLNDLIEKNDPYYQFLLKKNEIVQMLFSPTISKQSIVALKVLISEHLQEFKNLFPEKNITPKQHYLLHCPNVITILGPLIRHCCFGFESAHNYFKEMARKQNFKNLSKSLAERCQLLECCNFGDSSEEIRSHPLFFSERKYGKLIPCNTSKCQNLTMLFPKFGLLPGLQLRNVYSVSWIKMFGTKFSKNGVILCNSDSISKLPVFGLITEIFCVESYIYFQFIPYITKLFSEQYQAYLVTENSADGVECICAYDAIVDYNVYHVKYSKNNMLISPKYYLNDIICEHIANKNV